MVISFFGKKWQIIFYTQMGMKILPRRKCLFQVEFLVHGPLAPKPQICEVIDRGQQSNTKQPQTPSATTVGTGRMRHSAITAATVKEAYISSQWV